MKKATLLPLLIFILQATSCSTPTPTPTPAPEPSNAWSAPLTIGHAYRAEAPAIHTAADGWAVAWANGPALYFRSILADGTLGRTRTVLLGQMPWNPVLLPARGSTWHLLWQDLNTLGEVRLYNAIVDANGNLTRGPITTTSEPTGDTAIAPDSRRGAVVIWSDTRARPTLYGQRIDADGRPAGGTPYEIAHGASSPALGLSADNTWVVAWLAMPDSALSPSDSRTLTVRITDSRYPWEGADSPRALTRVSLPQGEQFIESTSLGLDRHFGYYFIGQRSAATRQPATRVITFPLIPTADVSAAIMDVPGIPTLANNTSEAFPVAWPMPGLGQHDNLPVAFSTGETIGIEYFEGGEVVRYETIRLDDPPLANTGFAVNDDNAFAVVWASQPPSEGQPAPLLMSIKQTAMANSND